MRRIAFPRLTAWLVMFAGVGLTTASAATPAPASVDSIAMQRGRQLTRWLPPEDWQPGPAELRFWIAREPMDGPVVVTLQNAWSDLRYRVVPMGHAERHATDPLNAWWVRQVDVDFTRRPLSDMERRPRGLAVAIGELLNTTHDAKHHELRLDGPERSALVRLEQIHRQDRFPEPAPTLRSVRYGPHARHLLDFYPADTTTPAPLAIFIHGGGWGANDKRIINGDTVRRLNAAGVSVAAISYCFLWMAPDEGVSPPVRAPMEDARRALQFLRLHADRLRVDPTRVAAWGGSAGGCTALWLAFHDDMAELDADDSLARQSTRLAAVAAVMPQTTLDPHQMRRWIGPEIRYGASAFAAGGFDRWHDRRSLYIDEIAAYSPYAHVTADDPPVYLDYGDRPNVVPSPPGDQPLATHHPAFGVHLAHRLDAVGVPHDLTFRDRPPRHWSDLETFLIDHLVDRSANRPQAEEAGPHPEPGRARLTP
ncbi:MAG: alpha/beta hydrolase [Planctomycetota bacterium]